MKKEMKEYIIYTSEGETIAPNEEYCVENCQVLGCVAGESPEDAINILLRDNPWILEANFSREKFIVRQLA
jgi:hypothetical protein